MTGETNAQDYPTSVTYNYLGREKTYADAVPERAGHHLHGGQPHAQLMPIAPTTSSRPGPTDNFVCRRRVPYLTILLTAELHAIM